jgi:hypothetical protein
MKGYDMTIKFPEPLLWLSDSRGVYIPRDFACSFNNRSKDVTGVSEDDWSVLEAGPHGSEYYWEVWQEVCDNATVTDVDGIVYTIYQDGYCWLIPQGMELHDDGHFFWPDQEEE